MREVLLKFGSASHLVGTATLPDETGAPAPLALVMFNAGLIPRQGPHRLNVRIARRLGSIGIPVLRFDLSGLGDSLTAPGGGSTMEERAITDIRAAVDAIQARTGATRIGVLGLCSGTDHCISSALADDRINVMILLDPWAFPTWRTHVNFAIRRYRHHGGFLKFTKALAGEVGRRLGIVRSASGGGHGAAGAEIDVRVRPPTDHFAGELMQLLDRGVAMYTIYTLGYPHAYNYASQFADVFSKYNVAQRVDCEFMPNTTHTFTDLATQEELLQRLERWCRRRFMESAARSSAPAGAAESPPLRATS